MKDFLSKYNKELIKAIFKELQKGNRENTKALILQLERNNKIIYIDFSK